MTTIMRSAAVAAVSFILALGTVACDDIGGGGGGGGGGTSTTSSTTSTTRTTSTTSTTTTTGGPNALACVITFGVTNTVTLGALQYDTDYTAAPGEFDGSADAVQCRDLTGSLASFNDNEGTRVLSAGLINLTGFSGPTDVVECDFTTNAGVTTPPTAADFAINVVDATDPSLAPATATVEITDISCTGTSVTTTTVSVTTTLGPTTTTTAGGGGGQFTIGFDLVDAVNVGALQLEVDYSAAPGGFDGSADSVACTDQTSSLASFNDIEAESKLNLGFINLAGFSGPTTVATCTFTSTGATPQPSDFAVSVVDAAAPDLSPITPTPTINVTVTPAGS